MSGVECKVQEEEALMDRKREMLRVEAFSSKHSTPANRGSMVSSSFKRRRRQ